MKQLAGLVIALMLPLSALADSETSNPDPLKPINQPIQKFNDFMDEKLVRQVAVGYHNVMPDFAERGVGNFFGNLRDVSDMVNNVLQGKPADGMSDFLRIVVNTTVGIGGLFDPATKIGLVDHNEDWGQTFGVWGFGPGPYVVMPGRGPSTIRDSIGLMLDSATNPWRYLEPVPHRNVGYAVDLIDTRAGLLGADKVVFGDRYIFFRDAYLQRREYLINDGQVSDPFADDF